MNEIGSGSMLVGVNGAGRSIGVRRTSYPSGPWVDAAGKPAKSPNAVFAGNYKEPEVESTDDTKKAMSNPDPHNYKVLDVRQVKDWLVAKINYPDCTNYEGNKVLVFKNCTAADLLVQGFIDPHFEPTEQGWFMALKLANMMTS